MSEKKEKTEAPWLKIAVAVACCVALLEFYRTFLAEPEQARPVHQKPLTTDRTCAQGDKACVAKLARKYAASLADAGRGDASKQILAAADALERGDCESAVKASQEVKTRSPDPNAMDDFEFTKEVVIACVLDDYADAETGRFIRPDAARD